MRTKQLDELEIYYIQLFNCFNNEYGLNLRTGGSRGAISETTKNILREKAMGRKASEITKQRMRESHRNRPLMSEAERLKRSLSALGKNKGKRHTPEQIEKIRIASTGRKQTEEVKKRMSQILMGNKRSLGNHHTNTTISKMKEAWKRRKEKGLPSNQY